MRPYLLIFPLSLPAKRTWTHITSAHPLVMCVRYLIRLSSRNTSGKGGAVYCAETHAAHVSTAQDTPALRLLRPSNWASTRLGKEETIESGVKEERVENMWKAGHGFAAYSVTAMCWYGRGCAGCVVPGAWVRATMDDAELSSRLQLTPALLFKHGLGILGACVALAA